MITRRDFCKNSVLLAGFMGMAPQVLASQQHSIQTFLQRRYPEYDIEFNRTIELKAPDIAENSAVVGIQVITELPSVEWIGLILPEASEEKVPIWFEVFNPDFNHLSTRIKMQKSEPLVVAVATDRILYYNWKIIKVVTSGPCG